MKICLFICILGLKMLNAIDWQKLLSSCAEILSIPCFFAFFPVYVYELCFPIFTMVECLNVPNNNIYLRSSLI